MTKAKKTKSEPIDLPAGWQWDKEATGWKAINPAKNLETTGCTTLKAAVAAAHRIDEKYGTDDDEEDPYPHAEFEAEQLAQEDRERLRNNAVARWRRERTASDGDEERSAPITTPIFLQIPIDQIAPSPTNPRKFFDEGKLQELADSIEAHGLIEPILVRPRRGDFRIEAPVHEEDGWHIVGGALRWTAETEAAAKRKVAELKQASESYEIVAGERRWRASQLVPSMTHIEAKVRDLDDRAVLEIQLIENLQREDVSPIEEADGYMAMLALKNEDGTSVYTVDSLAAKIGKNGKSKSYVYGRLKLRNLPAPALEAIAKGEVPATIGELIGRLPSMDLRERFWKGSFSGIENDWFRMPSFRDIKATIDREYMRELKGAPFDQNDKKLVPAAGNCKNCPKRTGNNRAEYPDGRADLCTDVICFKAKVEAFQKRQLKEAASDGVKVLSAQESKQILGYHGSVVWNRRNEWVTLAEPCDEAPEPEDEDAEYPTWAEMLGDIKPDAVAQAANGNLVRLVSKSRAAEILRSKHGIEIEREDSAGGDDEEDSFDRDEYVSEQKRRLQTREEAVERIAERVAESYDGLFFHDIGPETASPDLTSLIRTLAAALLNHFEDTVSVISTFERLNPAVTSEETDDLPIEEIIDRLLKDRDAADIVGVLAEVCVREQLYGWPSGYREVSPTVLEFLGLNLADFEQQALNELTPPAEVESKPKAKAKKMLKIGNANVPTT